MKKIALSVFLLISLLAFGQPAKDSLLVKDHAQVEARLKLMHYLDTAVLKHFTSITKKEIVEGEGLAYFYKKLVANSPVVWPSVAEYLGYTNGFSSNSNDFLNNLYKKNLDELIFITKLYGYPSSERIKIEVDRKCVLAVVFMARTDYKFKEVKKLLKSEIRIGNISQKEYDVFAYITND